MNESHPRPTPIPSQPNAAHAPAGQPPHNAAIRPIGAAAHPPRPAGGGAALGAPVRRIEPPPPHVVPQVPGTLRPPPPPAPADGPIQLEDEEPIALDDGPSTPVAPAPPRLAASGAGAAAQSQPGLTAPSKIKFATGGDKHTYTKFKRATLLTGTGACRVRSFHGRLSDDGLAFMDDKINEWLDNHPDVEVKFVNSLVGPLEGKVTGEQGLIVTLWY
jgi:hypothetical protein